MYKVSRVCPVCVPCVSRLPPVSFYRFKDTGGTGKKTPGGRWSLVIAPRVKAANSATIQAVTKRVGPVAMSVPCVSRAPGSPCFCIDRRHDVTTDNLSLDCDLTGLLRLFLSGHVNSISQIVSSVPKGSPVA